MITERNLIEMVETVMRTGGEDVSGIADLVGQPARVFTYPNSTNEYVFFAVDLIFRDDGTVVLQESNGSNGATTGMLPDGQARRAKHMAGAALARGLAAPSVVLLGHADKTGLKAEFYVRQMLLAAELMMVGSWSVKARGSGEALGSEEISVVIGPISELVQNVERRGTLLEYLGRPVSFAANANMLLALQRAGKIERDKDGFNVDTGIFHEGRRGVEVVLDKSEQQRCTVGTGLTPLRYEDHPSWHGLVEVIWRWHQERVTPVAKINGGSQSVGVEIVPPGDAGLIQAAVARMRAQALAAYGAGADATALPVRLFEFAASTQYRLPDGGHLWDVRVEAHVSPRTTTLIPTTMRICSEPFDTGHFQRAAVISNLSGRACGLEFVRTPFAQHLSGGTELKWAGVPEEQLITAMGSLANWCEAVQRPLEAKGQAVATSK
jgi:hypothetical protein